MKRTCLCHAKARKKILIPTITALLITAQLSPIAIAGMSDTEMMNCLSGLPKTVVIAEASVVDEPNSAELDKYYNMDKNGWTYDGLYSRLNNYHTGEVNYCKTLEALENNKELREALKKMLNIPSFLPRDMVGKGSDASAAPMSTIIAYNYGSVHSLLKSKSGRKKLAQLGEKYTDWIDADWAEAADLTVMAAFQVVNDDYGLIKYDKSKRTQNISREEFYTMLWRSMFRNAESSNYNLKTDNSKEELESIVGKDYKYAEFIYYVTDRMYGVKTMFNGGNNNYISKKEYQSDIPYLEAMSFIGGFLCSNYSTTVDTDKAISDLTKNFKNLKKSNFDAMTMDIGKHMISEVDACNLWAAWKAGVLKPTKNGNLKWTGTITYKQAVQLINKAIIANSKFYEDKSDYTDFVVLSNTGNKNNNSKKEEKKEVTLIKYN